MGVMMDALESKREIEREIKRKEAHSLVSPVESSRACMLPTTNIFPFPMALATLFLFVILKTCRRCPFSTVW